MPRLKNLSSAHSARHDQNGQMSVCMYVSLAIKKVCGTPRREFRFSPSTDRVELPPPVEMTLLFTSNQALPPPPPPPPPPLDPLKNSPIRDTPLAPA